MTDSTVSSSWIGDRDTDFADFFVSDTFVLPPAGETKHRRTGSTPNPVST